MAMAMERDDDRDVFEFLVEEVMDLHILRYGPQQLDPSTALPHDWNEMVRNWGDAADRPPPMPDDVLFAKIEDRVCYLNKHTRSRLKHIVRRIKVSNEGFLPKWADDSTERIRKLRRALQKAVEDLYRQLTKFLEFEPKWKTRGVSNVSHLVAQLLTHDYS
jgi:hypothetical protein